MFQMDGLISALIKLDKLIWLVALSVTISACGSDSNNPKNNPSSPDTTPPVISLLGDPNVQIEVGGNYEDAGATASDDIDGNISANVVTSGIVDTSVLGTYTLTYSISDSSGNNAAELLRTVSVVDTTPPDLSLIGDANITLEVGLSYTDEGATAHDNVDGDISANIVSSGVVNSYLVGSYMVTYNVIDASGNQAVSVSRTVNVVDTTPPVLSIIGDANVTLELGTSYVESGASALDNLDGDITDSVTATGAVDENTIGTYTLTYNVSDANGNIAVPILRTINVVDTTSPELVSTSPTASQTEVTTGVAINAVFNEPLLASSVESTAITVLDEGGLGVSGTVSLDTAGLVISFVPDNALMENTEYTVTLFQSISDTAMNGLANDITWQFNTINTSDAPLPQLINIPNNPADEPQLAMNNAGFAIAAWRQDGFINVNRYEPIGGWQGVEQVSVVADVAYADMKVAINDSGNAIVVWTEFDPNNGVSASSVYANRYSSASGWSGAEEVDGVDTGISEMAQVGIDELGYSIVAWRHRTSFQAEASIYVRRYDTVTNAWENSVAIFQPDDSTYDDAVSPSVAINAQGHAMVVWNKGNKEILARYYDPTTGWANESINITDMSDIDIVGVPHVSIDDNIKVIATWTQRLNTDSHPDIYANHFTLTDGWAGSVALETSQLGEARYPIVAMNDSHGVVVWTEYDGATYSLYTNVLKPDGTWEGVSLIENSDYSIFRSDNGGTSIAINGAGKAVIAWNQSLLIPETLAAEYRIFISERELSTSTTWSTPTALAQSELSTESYMPVVGVASDGTGVVVSQRLLSNSLDIQSHDID
ncbi:immunoglobulin-like domain-containing protein [uncultured Paraglaciecola sp.]|uniref:immunoglobulin-like domain-containing protein n=1 Tax=uncultured Paraglaciecola sp. TaxID=1765024 RepID=UPI0025933F4A|nr:immunoglobulin-like domain-containing protein [uncultured Paraglaciecola sp.]